MVSIAKADGEITRDTKMEMLDLFENEFGISRNKAIGLFSASTFMLKEANDIASEVKNILAPSKSDFDESHVKTLVDMMNKVSTFENEQTSIQKSIIASVINEFKLNSSDATNW